MKEAHEFAHAQDFLGNRTAKTSQMWAISSSACFAMNGSQTSDCRVFLQQPYDNRKMNCLSLFATEVIHQNSEELNATFCRIKLMSCNSGQFQW